MADMQAQQPPAIIEPASDALRNSRRVQGFGVPDDRFNLGPQVTPMPLADIINRAAQGVYGGTGGHVVDKLTTPATMPEAQQTLAGNMHVTIGFAGEKDAIGDLQGEIDNRLNATKTYVGAQVSGIEDPSEKAGYQDAVMGGGIQAGVSLQLDFMGTTNQPGVCIDLGSAELTKDGVRTTVPAATAKALTTTAPCARVFIPAFPKRSY